MAERAVELSSLIARLPASTQVNGNVAKLVTSIEIDSRKVKSGACFVAVRGEHTDGHAFVHQAIAHGAIVVIVEEAHVLRVPPHVTVLHVPDSRRALSAVSATFYGDPSHGVRVAGVTGTNGKTTTTRMIGAILEAGGVPCGTIGTVGAEFGERRWTLANTTPLPPELHALLASMRDAGAKAVAMEVSSHALALDRVDDVRFAVTALTNVTRDHLDFHETLDAYAAAKHRLFGMAPACVLNADDSFGKRWAGEFAQRGAAVTTYAQRGDADLVPTAIDVAPDGSRFTLGGQQFALSMPGRFNVSNALAAIGVGRVLGVTDGAAAQALGSLRRVPGRMEHVRVGEVDVVIDYAHTPDALENALRSLRETVKGTLSVVFGCGGDRDRGKRPQMGRIAGEYADRIYVTNDNPRTEDPAAIAEAIVAGMAPGANPVIELDRRSAIARAISDASAGDVVLIAGKGHESYQILGTDVVDFDDVAVAREALELREAAR
jgi:UDP-N-acetylmuramoyl-L-alanyl-D-glutamate--2,6-diaminopimelate ligase